MNASRVSSPKSYSSNLNSGAIEERIQNVPLKCLFYIYGRKEMGILRYFKVLLVCDPSLIRSNKAHI